MQDPAGAILPLGAAARQRGYSGGPCNAFAGFRPAARVVGRLVLGPE